ncbi:hypothetical protein NC652_038381 [Populus alba x Populus x berolinensis]|nr:hypothetical protein NC652_038381 [Populus alba x Populus x berolinensis]
MSSWVTSPAKHKTKHEGKTNKLVIFTNGRSLKGNHGVHKGNQTKHS